MSMHDINNEMLTEPEQTKALFPIREVARLTGINPITLRAWERRYGLIEPVRTESGHRLYSQEHITLIQKALKLVNDKGVPISQVKPLLESENVATPQVKTIDQQSIALTESALMNRIDSADSTRLNQLLDQIFIELPFSLAANLLINTRMRFNKAPNRQAAATYLLFDSLVHHRLQARLFHLQQKMQINRQTLLVQAASPKQPKWITALVAHFLSENKFNVILLDEWLSPDLVLDTIKTLECRGLCLVDDGTESQNITEWQDWLKTHVTLNNWLFGSNNAEDYQNELDNNCHIKVFGEWFNL